MTLAAESETPGGTLLPELRRMHVSRPPRLFLAALRHAGRDWTGGTFTLVHPDGESETFGQAGSGPDATLRVRDWAFARRALASGDIGVAESYIAGEWDTPDLATLLTVLADTYERLNRLAVGGGLVRAMNWLRHSLFRKNSERQAKRNIHAHYDLGNAFYSAWLDPSMTYSSALFAHGDEALEAAQARKYESLCEAMGLEPGMSVLEIGCGWGGFAEHAAARRGARVTGLTISQAQLDFARARMERQGLADQVELRFQDYRQADGQFDRIASIEMFEAVGEQYWPAYFRTIRERLTDTGRAGLQIITIDASMFDRYRKRVDFIQQYVFPGGMLISEPRLAEEAERAGLKVTATRRFGPDYARTLALWAVRFEAAWDTLRAQGFDEQFRRLWRFYLAYCEAGFRTGRTDVIQVVLEPA